MTSYTRHVGSDAAVVEMAHTVRRHVFMEEQGVSEAVEMDGKDDAATHVVLTDDETPVATARLRFVDASTAKIERVAVLSDYRGDGLGDRVMDAAERVAVDRGATDAVLHAQVRVQRFYERVGYTAVGDTFEEADIPHVEMRKRLD